MTRLNHKTPKTPSHLQAKVFAGMLSSQSAKSRGIGLHVITPVPNLTLAKDSAKADKIIGKC